MGRLKAYPSVKYFTALTFGPEVNSKTIFDKLQNIFSEIDSHSPIFLFDDFTRYYEKEMGLKLKKQIISFLELQPAEHLPDVKVATNEIEEKFRTNRGRAVNIDPGYLSAAKMILATTKDYDHRIYLGQGIFGDVHLRYRRGKFQFNDWTYPDYRQEQILTYFDRLRKTYLKQIMD
jgi:hypothetical protein